MLMVSKLMEWDQEEGIVNRVFTTEILTMEPIDLLERASRSKQMQTILEDLCQEDVDAIRRSIKADAFEKALLEEYRRIRDYLGPVGPNTRDKLVAECRELLGRNLSILYQIVDLDPSNPE